MEAYVVGGAVRDALLGRPVQDRDWVVVGATPAEMLARGFRPVGKDFPVFLHPESGEEYALARTERKSGHGYHGFVCHADPDVTLEQDLARRDLTINAIARRADGSLVDPYGGVADLRAKVFRHVSPAFAEDPLRILRVARFAARFTDFRIAPETLALMRQMAAAGEVDHLIAERVWQELARGLMEAKPSRMIEGLRGWINAGRWIPLRFGRSTRWCSNLCSGERRADQSPRQKPPAQGIEVKMAAVVAKALDDALQRRSRRKVHQRPQPGLGADVARREHVEPAEAAQQHEARAPRADARKLGEDIQRRGGAHAGDCFFAQLARGDRSGKRAQRLGLARAQAALPQPFETGSGDGLRRGKRVQAAAILLEACAESLDQPAHDGNACVQAQLLERHHVRESLEQPR